MNPFIIDNAVPIRFGFFLIVFIGMAAWERLSPRRPLTASRRTRWFGNLAVTFLNPVVLRLVFPLTAIEVAILSREHQWGVLNAIGGPGWLKGAAAVVALDLAIYLQHVLFHRVHFLWRFHRMHHIDFDIDVTTGARFHPIEIVLSMVLKIATIVLLGAPPLSVLVFEILLNATSMFNHSNILLPLCMDGLLRLFLVTPDMHRVHHSILRQETNSNFGFNMPWWDRLFGTYRAQPAAGHESMVIGLGDFREGKYLSLPWMIAVPFLRKRKP